MCKRVLKGNLLVLWLSLVCSFNVASNDQVKINKIPYFEEAISIDGNLDESIWEKALKVSLIYEVRPAENIQAPVITQAYIFEDGENLFIAFDAKDPEANKIRGYLSARDEIERSDFVRIELDTFADSRKAFQFSVNAMGVQADAIIDEITGRTDDSWDSIWESKGAINPNGYIVEMAIPFKSLRFDDGEKIKKWGIRFSRIWSRDVEHELTNSPTDRNNECILCQFSLYQGFEKNKSLSNLMITPAITFTRNDQRDPINNTPWESGDFDNRVSLDLRWGINQNTIVNATINPDFSQVEADEIQLNANNRFASYVAEKRAFFLDGADYFSNWSRLVHTKLFSEPEYGIKVTGKSGRHSYGIMTLKDKDTTFLLPDSQSSRLVSLQGTKSENKILRYRYDIGKKANIGFTYTGRKADSYSNDMFSLDGKFRFSDSDYIKFQVMSSENEYPVEIQQNYTQDDEISGSAFSINYTHSTRDWVWTATHHQFGKNFRAESGFIARSDWEATTAYLSRKWYASDKRAWWKNTHLVWQSSFSQNTDGLSLRDKNTLQFVISADYESELFIVAESIKERYIGELDNLNFNNGQGVEQNLMLYELDGALSLTSKLNTRLSFLWGEEIDYSSGEVGSAHTITFELGYQFNEHLKLSLENINKELEVIATKVVDYQLFNFRANYEIDLNSTLRITFQGDAEDSSRYLASQFLYSYKLNPFTLFYLGYSDEGFKTLELEHLRKSDRTFFAKFSYAWEI